MSDFKLGRKVIPKDNPPPEWQRIKGTPFEKNAQGQKRTAIPANECANQQPYGYWSGPIIGSAPLPQIDEDNI